MIRSGRCPVRQLLIVIPTMIHLAMNSLISDDHPQQPLCSTSIKINPSPALEPLAEVATATLSLIQSLP